MGDLSKDFSRKEFKCKCGCTFDTVDAELLKVLQEDVRDYYNKKVTILSGCRCFMYNMHTLGAARGSQHVEGKASDFTVEGVAPLAVYTHLNKKYPGKYGIGLYHNRVHFDSREEEARWKRVD